MPDLRREHLLRAVKGATQDGHIVGAQAQQQVIGAPEIRRGIADRHATCGFVGRALRSQQVRGHVVEAVHLVVRLKRRIGADQVVQLDQGDLLAYAGERVETGQITGVVALHVSDHYLDAAQTCGVDQFIRLVQIHHHRLLDKHMLARACRGDRGRA